MLRILGIDPGTRVLGYAVVEATDDRAPRLELVECGVVEAEEAALAARLAEISRGLGEVIAELRPDVVAIEDVFTRINPRTALVLGQGRGAALAAIGLAGLAAFSYPPALVKKTITGQGRAEKSQVARMVRAVLGLHHVPRSDAADALAIAITHAHLRHDLETLARRRVA